MRWLRSSSTAVGHDVRLRRHEFRHTLRTATCRVRVPPAGPSIQPSDCDSEPRRHRWSPRPACRHHQRGGTPAKARTRDWVHCARQQVVEDGRVLRSRRCHRVGASRVMVNSVNAFGKHCKVREGCSAARDMTSIAPRRPSQLRSPPPGLLAEACRHLDRQVPRRPHLIPRNAPTSPQSDGPLRARTRSAAPSVEDDARHRRNHHATVGPGGACLADRLLRHHYSASPRLQAPPPTTPKRPRKAPRVPLSAAELRRLSGVSLRSTGNTFGLDHCRLFSKNVVNVSKGMRSTRS